MTDLLPCPLCQSANLRRGVTYGAGSSEQRDSVMCLDCGCRATEEAWQSRVLAQGSPKREEEILALALIINPFADELDDRDAGKLMDAARRVWEAGFRRSDGLCPVPSASAATQTACDERESNDSAAARRMSGSESTGSLAHAIAATRREDGASPSPSDHFHSSAATEQVRPWSELENNTFFPSWRTDPAFAAGCKSRDQEVDALTAEIARLQEHKRKQMEDIMSLGQQVGALETELAHLRAEPQAPSKTGGECDECKKPATSLNSNGMCEKCAEDLQIWLRHGRIGCGRSYQEEVARARRIEAERATSSVSRPNRGGE